MKDKKKSPVVESPKVFKAREKLKKKMEAIEKKITQQALDRKSFEIHRWIAKNAADRMGLYDKDVSLFDENQNTAKVSRKVGLLAEKLQGEMNPLQELLAKEKEIVLE